MKALRSVAHSAPPCGESLLEAVEGIFDDAALAEMLGVDGDAALTRELRHVALRPASDFLRRPGKRFRARLVELGWELAEAPGTPPSDLAHMVELLHAGSMIVDDIEDGSQRRRGQPALHVLHGVPLALNTGNLLYFLPLGLLRRLRLGAAAELALHRRIARTMVRAHCGPALDLGTALSRLPQAELLRLVRASSDLKTGSLMGLAASIGAVAANATPLCVQALTRFGEDLGVALQMFDDIGNLRGAGEVEKRHEDLRLGRPTWIWAWLARDLGAAEFTLLQRQAAAVESGDAPPAVLAARLARALGQRGKDEAQARLRAALAELERAFAGHPALDALASECVRLGASYG
jgi:geranylgeranyl pyrophosphate synthase